VKFRNGLINEEVNKSVGNSKIIGVINKIDKIKNMKFPENLCEMKSDIESVKNFIFISCKEFTNIQNLIQTLKKQVTKNIFLIFFKKKNKSKFIIFHKFNI